MIKLRNFIKSRRGFLLVDSMIAVIIVGVAFVGLLGMYLQATTAGVASANTQKAMMVAQEYMEILRKADGIEDENNPLYLTKLIAWVNNERNNTRTVDGVTYTASCPQPVKAPLGRNTEAAGVTATSGDLGTSRDKLYKVTVNVSWADKTSPNNTIHADDFIYAGTIAAAAGQNVIQEEEQIEQITADKAVVKATGAISLASGTSVSGNIYGKAESIANANYTDTLFGYKTLDAATLKSTIKVNANAFKESSYGGTFTEYKLRTFLGVPIGDIDLGDNERRTHSLVSFWSAIGGYNSRGDITSGKNSVLLMQYGASYSGTRQIKADLISGPTTQDSSFTVAFNEADASNPLVLNSTYSGNVVIISKGDITIEGTVGSSSRPCNMLILAAGTVTFNAKINDKETKTNVGTTRNPVYEYSYEPYGSVFICANKNVTIGSNCTRFYGQIEAVDVKSNNKFLQYDSNAMDKFGKDYIATHPFLSI